MNTPSGFSAASCAETVTTNADAMDNTIKEAQKMSKTYYIRGTITMRVDCVEGGKSKVGVTPCAGFLSPDKPQNAIAFPLPETKNDPDQISTALLIGLNERNACEFGAIAIEPFMPVLLSIAGQQKPVELHLSREEDGSLKIVGFVYPSP